MQSDAAVNWSHRPARKKLLNGIVANADRLLELARQAHAEPCADNQVERAMIDAAELLGQWLVQDVKRGPDGVGDGGDDADDKMSIADVVGKDRVGLVHCPEMRHGHQTSRRRFHGHKAALVVDTDTQLITAVNVLPGNARDSLGALELVEQTEARPRVPVIEATGDTAHGYGGTRQDFADSGRKLVACTPGRSDQKHLPKNDFVIDLAEGICTCPAGRIIRQIVPMGTRIDRTGHTYKLEDFGFRGAVCDACSQRPRCVAAGPGIVRTMWPHGQGALSQEARALRQSPACKGRRENVPRGRPDHLVWVSLLSVNVRLNGRHKCHSIRRLSG